MTWHFLLRNRKGRFVSASWPWPSSPHGHFPKLGFVCKVLLQSLSHSLVVGPPRPRDSRPPAWAWPLPPPGNRPDQLGSSVDRTFQTSSEMLPLGGRKRLWLMSTRQPLGGRAGLAPLGLLFTSPTPAWTFPSLLPSGQFIPHHIHLHSHCPTHHLHLPHRGLLIAASLHTLPHQSLLPEDPLKQFGSHHFPA